MIDPNFDPSTIATTPEPSPVQEPVAWEDGPHLVMRADMRERLAYTGPWVDMGRAIPDGWVPVLYTTPPAQPPVQEPVQPVAEPKEYTMGNWFNDLEHPHGNR